jgi:hypothetical protein
MARIKLNTVVSILSRDAKRRLVEVTRSTDRELDKILKQNQDLHKGSTPEISAKLTSAFAQGELYGRLRARKQYAVIDHANSYKDIAILERLYLLETGKRKSRKKPSKS